MRRQCDSRYDDPEGLAQIVTGLRRVYDDLDRLKHLQMEFIEDHKQIAEGVFETVHGNGERVIVNYGESPHVPSEDITVPPRAYRLLAAMPTP